MGYAIAEEAAARGALVTLVSGPVSIAVENQAINLVKVESGKEMLAACEDVFPQTDIAILSAAVADYALAEYRDHKIKRELNDIPTISLVKNPDIAATLGARKKRDRNLWDLHSRPIMSLSMPVENLRRKIWI